MFLMILCAVGLRGEFKFFGEHTGFRSPQEGSLHLKSGAPLFMTDCHTKDNDLMLSILLRPDRGASGIRFVLVNENRDSMLIAVTRPAPSLMDELEQERFTVETVILKDGNMGAPPMIRRGIGHQDSRLYSGHAGQLTLRAISRDSVSLLQIAEGEAEPAVLAEFADEPVVEFLAAPLVECGLAPGLHGGAEVLRMSVATVTDADDYLSTGHTPDSLAARFATTADPLEGYWTLLDYTVDDSVMRAGGDYLLALVRRGEGGYLMIYVDGALRNREQWQLGRIKGECRPGRLPNVYHLVWYTADDEPITEGCSMELTGPRTLTLLFPHLGSQLRFQKIPAPR